MSGTDESGDGPPKGSKPGSDDEAKAKPGVGPGTDDLIGRSMAAFHERGLGAESVKAADDGWDPPSDETTVPEGLLDEDEPKASDAEPMPPTSKDVGEDLTDPVAADTEVQAASALAGADEEQHYETKPEDRIPFLLKLVYGVGAFVNNILAAAIGEMIKVLNLGMGVDPAIVGWIGALPRLTDALTDPLMGYISDHTRSRWGRRRPYIMVGAIAAGLLYIALWMFPLGQSETFYFVWFVVGSLLFYLAYTVYATPWVALGYELTPDYHERTRLMGVQNFIGQLAYVVSPWFMWITTLKIFRDQVQGAAMLAVVIGVSVMFLGVLPAIFLRERFVKATKKPDEEGPVVEPPLDQAGAAVVADPVAKESGGLLAALLDFFKGLYLALKSGPFLLLAGATFLVFNGFILIGAFQYYVIVYYIFGGNQELGAEWAGYSGTLGAVSTFIVIPIVTWLATRVGKRKAFFIAIGISVFGYSLKWFCYDPEVPLLMLAPAPLMAFGLGGLFTLMGSMVADVVDVDELTTYQRREGMFGSIFWWVVKLGMAVAIAAGGYLLNFTGFDVALDGNQTAETLVWMRGFDAFVPAMTSIIAIVLVYFYPITEEVAHQTRAELERRRAIED